MNEIIAKLRNHCENELDNYDSIYSLDWTGRLKFNLHR